LLHFDNSVDDPKTFVGRLVLTSIRQCLDDIGFYEYC